MTAQKKTGARCVPGVPFQWHLKTSRYDACPECGGEVGYLSQFERICLGECALKGLGWSIPHDDRQAVVETLERRAALASREWTNSINVPAGRVGEWAVEHIVRPAGSSMPIENARTALMTGRKPFNVTFETPTTWHRLTQGGSVWMTDYPIEQAQHDRELAPMSGRVLVGGLGLGYAVSRLCESDDVTSVVCVEKSPEVIELVAEHVAHPKLMVVAADLFEYLKQYDAPEFDWGFYDIWQSDSEMTFHEVVVPLRSLSEGKVDCVVCWNEDVMRGQIAMGLRARTMLLTGDQPPMPGSPKPTPETFMAREDIYSSWALPFWRAMRDGKVPLEDAVGMSQLYASMYGNPGWRDNWELALGSFGEVTP